MSLRDLIRRSGRSLKSAKTRTFLTASAIAVGTFALTLTIAASNGATAYVDKLISQNFDPAELIVTNDSQILGTSDTSKPREYDANFGSVANRAGVQVQIKRISDDDINKIKQISGVERVRENIAVNFKYFTRPDQKKYVGTLQAFNPYEKPDLLSGQINRPLGNKQLVLPEGLLSSLGFKDAAAAVGQTLTIAVQKPLTETQIRQGAASVASGQSTQNITQASEQATQLEDFTITGVYKKPTSVQPGSELAMYIGLDDARALNDISTQGSTDYHKYTYVYARVKGGENEKTLSAVQDKIKQQGYTVQSVKDTQQFLTQIISILQGIVAAFGAIAVIASVFGIVNTMYISVLQRTREIGLMKALGMRKRDIGRLFRFEAAWIGFLGGTLGSLLAVGLGAAINPWITTKLGLGAGNKLLIFHFSEIAILIIILMVISILAGWLPSRKAAKLDPIEALRTE